MVCIRGGWIVAAQHYYPPLIRLTSNNMKTLDKILHHIAFTLFWLLIIASIAIWIWILILNEKQDMKSCLDKGHSYEQCAVEK